MTRSCTALWIKPSNTASGFQFVGTPWRLSGAYDARLVILVLLKINACTDKTAERTERALSNYEAYWIGRRMVSTSARAAGVTSDGGASLSMHIRPRPHTQKMIGVGELVEQQSQGQFASSSRTAPLMRHIPLHLPLSCTPTLYASGRMWKCRVEKKSSWCRALEHTSFSCLV